MRNTVEEFDNVFSDKETKIIYKKVDVPRWRFGHAGIPNSYRKFWHLDLTSDPFFSTELFEKIQIRIMAKCKLSRVFANGQTYGQDGDWHQDRVDKDNYTFVYYANSSWKPEWGGETDFQIDNKIQSYSPEVNKGIFFPGFITHRGLAPSRDCYALRVTIAYQCSVLEWLR